MYIFSFPNQWSPSPGPQLNSPQHVACRTWPQDHQPLQQPPNSETITVETQKRIDTTYMLGTTPPMRPPPTATLTTVSNRPKSPHISTLRTPQPTTVSGRGRCNPAAAAALAASRSQISQITRYIDVLRFDEICMNLCIFPIIFSDIKIIQGSSTVSNFPQSMETVSSPINQEPSSDRQIYWAWDCDSSVVFNLSKAKTLPWHVHTKRTLLQRWVVTLTGTLFRGAQFPSLGGGAPTLTCTWTTFRKQKRERGFIICPHTYTIELQYQ